MGGDSPRLTVGVIADVLGKPMSNSDFKIPFAPQLCLSMIVRNEAKVIRRCLESVRPAIGAWAIVDTGSTDGTQDIIRECMADLPGQLIEREWVDFATNRNQALDLARSYGEYALIIDADEILEITPSDWPLRLDTGGYYLHQVMGHGEFQFSSSKLLRHDAEWHWEGVLHEYPAADPRPEMRQLNGLVVRSFPDGARSQRPQRDKFMDDVRVLEVALQKEPRNQRYAFYLAQSLRDAGEPAAALDAYRRRVALGGWEEEIWYSLFQIGALLEQLKASAGEIIDAYLAAHDARPARAEALCELARYLRLSGRYASAYMHAQAAARIPLPADLLFIDHSVYRWRARDEQAVSAFYIERRAECAQISRELLDEGVAPAEQHARLKENIALCG